MSDQPPVQPPDQPASPPPSQPTQPLPAAGPPAAGPPAGPQTPLAGSPAAPTGFEPGPNMWSPTTSTRGGRWGLAIAAGALVCLMILGVAVAGIVVLRTHDRVNLMGNRQDRQFLSQNGPGNGRGSGADGKLDRKAQKEQLEQLEMPGMPGGPAQGPGGRGHGMGGLGNLLGATALHGDVTGTFNGSVQALLFQRGEVTAVSETSITLKSSDGFVGTYGRNATTNSRGAVPVKGGQAFVLARSSDKVAITIMATRDLAGVAPSS